MLVPPKTVVTIFDFPSIFLTLPEQSLQKTVSSESAHKPDSQELQRVSLPLRPSSPHPGVPFPTKVLTIPVLPSTFRTR